MRARWLPGMCAMGPLIIMLCDILGASGIKVNFFNNYTEYIVRHTLKGDNIDLFAGRGFAVFASGEWHAFPAQPQVSPLTFLKAEGIGGTDPVLGEFDGVEVRYVTRHGIRVCTRVKNFGTGLDVLFETHFLDGAPGTNASAARNSSHNEVSTNFPTFTTLKLSPALSWEGSFVSPVIGSASTGPTGGPCVFFDVSTPVVVVGSAYGNFKDTSAGPGHPFNDTKIPAWAPGVSGTIQSLPKGFTFSLLLHAGATASITGTIGEWGEILQRRGSLGVKGGGTKLSDVTLEKIGYQTDNGAAYCFCTDKNCSDTLIQVMDYYNTSGVPLGYLSFQGAGASSGRGSAAPWCVDVWGVDGGLSSQYPLSVKELHDAVGVPLQLYAPYFCPNSPYFNQSTKWESVRSDESLPDCEMFAFQDVSPEQSRDFYLNFFKRGMAAGMASFEPDFMNQNYNCVPHFVHNAGAATKWQQGMASAGASLALPIQWCYAAPTDVLASTEMRAVTNLRVSTDFCYGRSWDIGISSLIVWAAGAAPSKDTLWSTTNGRYEVPGCNWTPDHESPAVPLHIMLALMSTGPVGISDMIGHVNASVVIPAITKTGVLLKPSKPVTTIESLLLKPEAGTQILGTFGVGPSWYFVSFLVDSTKTVTLSDMFPRPTANLLAYRRFDGGKGCLNGSIVSVGGRCLEGLVSLDERTGSERDIEIFRVPASSKANITGGSNFSPVLTLVIQPCPKNAWIFLGELEKYVSLSPVRFSQIRCTKEGVSAILRASHRPEVIRVTALEPIQDSHVSNSKSIQNPVEWRVHVKEVNTRLEKVDFRWFHSNI